MKKTRLVSSMLSGYSPEFFTYFDVKCPLTSKYDTNLRRTISLAELLDIGQLTFEVWNKFVDSNEKVSILLNKVMLLYRILIY